MKPPKDSPITQREEWIGFYHEIGRAIAAWAHLELCLYWVAAMAHSKRDRAAFATTFFSIDSFHNKLKVADRLFKSKYGKSRKHVSKWTPLFVELDRLAKIRNQIAHNPVMGYPKAKPGRRYALISRLQQPSKFRQTIPKPPSGSLCIGDIIHAERCFTATAFALEFLYYDLLRRRSQLPASFAQAPDKTTIQFVTHRIRAKFSLLAPPLHE